MEELEAARPYVSALWDVRLDTVENVEDGVWAAVQAQDMSSIRVATSASVRYQLVSALAALPRRSIR